MQSLTPGNHADGTDRQATIDPPHPFGEGKGEIDDCVSENVSTNHEVDNQVFACRLARGYFRRNTVFCNLP